MFLVFAARSGFFSQIYPWRFPRMTFLRACPLLPEWYSSGELSSKTEAVNVRATNEHLLGVRGSTSDQNFVFFLIYIYFWCEPFLKSFIEFVTILLLFYVLVFWLRVACGILAPWPGIEPVPPALEGEVLTTGPPGKSPDQRWIAPSFGGDNSILC